MIITVVKNKLKKRWIQQHEKTVFFEQTDKKTYNIF